MRAVAPMYMEEVSAMSDPNAKVYIRIRVRFSKHGPVKYVGHLDMMRFFQKAIRRAGFDIRYSEGFSPHQVISFAAPLGVGMESDAEYFDMDMISTLSSEESIQKLNAQMTPGIRVLSYVELPQGAAKAMAAVSAADYEIMTVGKGMSFAPNMEILNSRLENFMAVDSLPLKKKTKKGGEKVVDIKPLVLKLVPLTENVIMARVCQGSSRNLNIRTLALLLAKCCGLEYDEASFMCVRKEVYCGGFGDGPLRSLDSIGREI